MKSTDEPLNPLVALFMIKVPSFFSDENLDLRVSLLMVDPLTPDERIAARRALEGTD